MLCDGPSCVKNAFVQWAKANVVSAITEQPNTSTECQVNCGTKNLCIDVNHLRV